MTKPSAKYSKRKSRPGQLSQPVLLATILSALVLVVYFLSIPGVVVTLERQTSSDGRSLETSAIRDEDVDFHGDALGTDKRAKESNNGASAEVKIPFSKWPMMIRDEENPWETVTHPADNQTKWAVPKFWSLPVHNGKLMPREFAMKIGTCAAPNSHGEWNRGADCPLYQRTIFVMIASYRDFQCRETVEQIYSRASFPGRIRVGIVDQIVEGHDNHCDQPAQSCDIDPNQALCKYHDLIEAVVMDAENAVGPVPARHVGSRMYRGEYYAMQIDAHISFVNNWEMSLIQELEASGNEMAVLSTYLSDVVNSIDEEGNSRRPARPIMCNSRWQQGPGGYHVHHSTQPESMPYVHGMPTLHPWWSAGFSFARGHFSVNVPYDLYLPMVFSGEEMEIAMRAWTIGYDLYTPERSVCFHHYAESPEGIEKRKGVPTFWEHAAKYEGAGAKGMRRLLGIIHMNPEVDPKDWDHTDEWIYGIGGVRKPEKLMEIIGMNFVNKTVESRLCRFVNINARMHKMFTRHLRVDGMGINYARVNYRYKYNPDADPADDVQETIEDQGDEVPMENNNTADAAADAEEGDVESDEGDDGEDTKDGAAEVQ